MPPPTHSIKGVYIRFSFLQEKKKFRDNSNIFSFPEFSLRLINLFEINYTILVRITNYFWLTLRKGYQVIIDRSPDKSHNT